MGLILAGLNAASGVMADQWKEYFYCDALPTDVLAVRGRKKTRGLSSNHGSDNIITNGSVIAVADGQCMMIVEQGRILDVCAEPGEYTFESTSSPSIMAGGLNKESIMSVISEIGTRFTFGGSAAKDQRIYYFNTKELMSNKFGTPAPVPFRVVDQRAGIDIDVSLRCFGEYSYRITNPVLFYTNVCGNVTNAYTRSQIEGQMKTELLTQLQSAFARISEMGIRYSALPGHAVELRDALSDLLTADWKEKRGIEIVSVGIASAKVDPEDEKMLKELQRNAAFVDPNLRTANMAAATASAMQTAAGNQGAGAAMAFMGMNMAGAMGNMAQNAFAQPIQQVSQPAPATAAPVAPAAPSADAWTCSCGHVATGKFCPECGAKKPEPKPADGWTCPTCGNTVSGGKFCPECGTKRPVAVEGWTCSACGTVNKGKFCLECGAKKPAAAPLYRCDKCGWEPKDPTNPPKFCPECGDLFDENDIQ